VDLEAQMAKALEGKFFWEPTNRFDEPVSKESIEIVRAQRKFQTPKETKYTPDVRVKAPVDRIRAMAEKRAKILSERQERLECYREHVACISDLALEAVSEVYGYNPADVTGRTRDQHIMVARHHHAWAVKRYLPGLSYLALGKHLGRDHATIMNSMKKFERYKGIFADKVRAVDEIMGYVPG